MLLVAAAFFSAYTVAAKPLIEKHGGVTVMTYATLAGSLPVVALSLPVADLVAWLVLGQSYTWIKLGGAAVTLAGVALAQFGRRG